MAASGYRWDYTLKQNTSPPMRPKCPFIPSQNPPPVWRAVDRQAVLGSVSRRHQLALCAHIRSTAYYVLSTQ